MAVKVTNMDINKLFDKFLSENNGKAIEVYDPSSKDQCVDLFLLWLKYLGLNNLIPLGITIASEIWKHPKMLEYFDFVDNTPDYVPHKGDIIVWKKGYGGAGHVAVATGTGNLNTFAAFSQNDPLGSKSHVVNNYSYSYVYGGARLKNAEPMDNTDLKAAWWFDLMNAVIWGKPREEVTDEMVQGWAAGYKGMLQRSGWYDKVVQYIKGATNIDTNQVSADALIKVVASWKGLNTQLQEALAEIKNREEQVVRLKEQLLNNEKFYQEQLNSLKSCLNQVDVKQSELDTSYARVGELEKELARCKAGQETARQNLIDKVIGFIKSIWPL